MKKVLLSLLCLGVAAPALAKNTKPKFVFVPENVVVESVADVKNKSDDTLVVMQGQILKSLGHDKYTFADKTGEIVIEIDEDDFAGMTVTAGEMIEISGEVDKDLMKPAKVEVKKLRKLNNQ